MFSSAIRCYSGSLFGLTSRHQVLINLAGIERLFSGHNFSFEPTQYTVLARVFGGQDSPDLKAKFMSSAKDLSVPVERMFLSEAAVADAIERAGIPDKVSSLITFSATRDPKSLQRWERSASVHVIDPGFAVEADFQTLIRDLGACIAIPLLYGHDFLDRYEELLDDFWTFDNDLFLLCTLGLPTWLPFEKMRNGVAARTRLLAQIEALSRRIDQFQAGEAIDFGADMSDISSVAIGRATVFKARGWTSEQRAAAELGILWGQNANTHPMTFWLLIFIYSTPELADVLREELNPYVSVSENGTKITAMDQIGLARNCPRFKACLFETYRMANEPNSIRQVEKDMTVPDGNHNHHLKAGTFVSVPHAIHQWNPDVYPDPDKFVADRFLEVNEETGKLAARYGKLKPWGVGSNMCKGRTFAEREILSVAAAVLMLWDVSPTTASWELPGMLPGTGVKKPVRDVRVVITRRKMVS